MPFLLTLWGYITGFFSQLWSLLLSWLSLFIAPFQNPELLWIIIPIWLSWFFAEFFQEKKSTSFGNAISNGIVPVWVAIDWMRLLVGRINSEHLLFSWLLVLKFAICTLAFTYGVVIIVASIKVRKYVPYIARIREVTYVLLMFTPIIYGVVDASWNVFASMILFFPVFYIIIEYFDWITPDPDIIREDSNSKAANGSRLQANAGQPRDEAYDIYYNQYPPQN
jgi:hypothetical protein